MWMNSDYVYSLDTLNAASGQSDTKLTLPAGQGINMTWGWRFLPDILIDMCVLSGRRYHSLYK